MTDPDDLPSSPSGRVPKWVVDERLRGRIEESGYVPGSAQVPRPAGARHRRPSVSPAVVVVALVVVLAGWFGVRVVVGDRPGAAPAASGTVAAGNPAPNGGTGAAAVAADGSGRTPNAPPAGIDERPARVLPAVDAAASTAWTPFLRQPGAGSAGDPVRWDPCRPVRYVVRTDGAPPGGAEVLVAAFREVSAASGLSFVPDGGTDETPSADREAYQPDRYGNRWAPVLVAWERAQENPALAADVAGQAGPTALRIDGRPAVYVTGVVELDADQLRTLLATPEGRAVARAVILHELGHLVGLGHVDDPAQLMYPKASGTLAAFGPGDLAGLAALGRGPCAPWL